MFRILLLVSLMLGAGCTRFPEVDAAIGAEAGRRPAPRILPFETLFDQAGEPTIDAETGQSLARRAALLRQKARALRTPVLSARDRRRLLTAVERRAN